MSTHPVLDETSRTPVAVHPTSPAVLTIFWAAVMIPLAWGVINTLIQAAKLFH